VEANYKVISAASEGLYKEKGSKFICYLRPAISREMATEVIAEVKALHPKGRHHCYAFIIGKSYELEMSSDDGEPSGSAGKPILGQLKSFEITNCIAVVVRYFGGTKLGIPGLINAYKSSTRAAIEQTDIIDKTICQHLHIHTDYSQMGHLLNVIKRLDLNIIKKEFLNDVKLILEISIEDIEEDFGKLKAGLLGLDHKEYDGSFDPEGFTFDIQDED
jgi:uncharacterized YigZ family protein